MSEILSILNNIHPEYDYSVSQDFIADGLLDSFDVVILVSALEEKFGINIDGSDVTPENFRNIATLENLLNA